MTSSQLLGATTFIYLFASFLYLLVLVFKAKKVGIAGTAVTIVGFLIQTAGIIMRWIESYKMGIGHAPLSNMYESLVIFSWAIALFYLVVEFVYKNRMLGGFAMPFAFASMAYGSYAGEISRDIKPLVPALQSNWLLAHVFTCFIGYAAFAVACGIGVVYLLKDRREKGAKRKGGEPGVLDMLPPLKTIDEIIHKSLVFGFLWLSAGIITGAVWANSAWGTYWSWDPKETWSLITWFVYAVALHARFTKGWGGRRIAWIAILGFLSVLFTYYGVNFWLSGLHSYGQG